MMNRLNKMVRSPICSLALAAAASGFGLVLLLPATGSAARKR